MEKQKYQIILFKIKIKTNIEVTCHTVIFPRDLIRVSVFKSIESSFFKVESL